MKRKFLTVVLTTTFALPLTSFGYEDPPLAGETRTTTSTGSKPSGRWGGRQQSNSSDQGSSSSSDTVSIGYTNLNLDLISRDTTALGSSIGGNAQVDLKQRGIGASFGHQHFNLNEGGFGHRANLNVRAARLEQNLKVQTIDENGNATPGIKTPINGVTVDPSGKSSAFALQGDGLVGVTVATPKIGPVMGYGAGNVGADATYHAPSKGDSKTTAGVSLLPEAGVAIDLKPFLVRGCVMAPLISINEEAQKSDEYIASDFKPTYCVNADYNNQANLSVEVTPLTVGHKIAGRLTVDPAGLSGTGMNFSVEAAHEENGTAGTAESSKTDSIFGKVGVAF